MNIFATDHPLCGDEPGTREKGALLSVLALALMLWPILCGLLWLLNAADNQGTTDYSPDPSWEVALTAAVDGLVLAVVTVALYRLIAGVYRELRQNGSRTSP